MDWLRELLGLPASFSSDQTGGGVLQPSASDAALVALLAALHRASGGAHRARWRRRRAVHRLHLEPDPLIGREGLPHRRPGFERAAQDRRRSGHPGRSARTPARADRGRRRGRHDAGADRVVGRRDRDGRDRPDPRAGRRSPASTAPGCTSTRPGPASPPSAPNTSGSTTAPSSPTRTAPTRTSGCSPTSTAARSGSPIGPPCIGALSILPEYLRNAATESGAVIDYRDWQVALGRRFRALKVWAVIRCYGVEGLQAHIREHVRHRRRVRVVGCGRRAVRASRAASAVARHLPAPGRRRRDDGADEHGQ